jgi:hypothetical protein
MDEFFARNRLSAYIDGELSDAEMAEVARAIEEQPEVREAYQALLTAVELVRDHGPVQAPAGFHAGVMRQVEGLSGGRSWFERLFGPLGRHPVQGLGVAVVAAAVLLLVFRGPVLDGELPGSSNLPSVTEREAAVPGPEAGEGAEQGEAMEPPAVELEPEVQQQGSASAEPAPSTEKRATEVSTKAGLGSKGSARSGTAKAVPIEELLEKEEGTYIPDWDKESTAPTATLGTAESESSTQPDPADAAGSLATSPYAYRLTPNEPDVLRKLVALAERLGGGVYTASGEPFDPYILTVERNYARVVLQIPASRLESVEPYLEGMGGVVEDHADPDRLFRADAVHVTVEVQYQP